MHVVKLYQAIGEKASGTMMIDVKTGESIREL